MLVMPRTWRGLRAAPAGGPDCVAAAGAGGAGGAGAGEAGAAEAGLGVLAGCGGWAAPERGTVAAGCCGDSGLGILLGFAWGLMRS